MAVDSGAAFVHPRPMDITITYNPKQASAFTDRRILAATARAFSKAGGDALRKIRTEGNKLVRARKRIKAGRVRQGLPTSRKGSTSNIASLEWRMRISGRNVPLAFYPHRQTKAGVSVEINPGQRKVIKGAFVATMKSGHKGVFERMGKKRLKIEELKSSTLTNVFMDPDSIPAVQATAQRTLSSAFDRLLPVELAKVI